MLYEVQSNAYWSILNALTGIILAYRKGSIIEIGIDIGGGSTGVLGRHATMRKTNFYTCDIDPLNSPKIDCEHHLHFNMSSLDFIKDYKDLIAKDRPAVVLLDGSHDYNVVIKEVEFFFKHLVVGGVIFIHDTLPPSEEHTVFSNNRCGNVYLVRQEIGTWGSVLDYLTWPYTGNKCGVTMIIKNEINPPYYRR